MSTATSQVKAGQVDESAFCAESDLPSYNTVHKLLCFVTELCRARSAIFYWVGPQCQMIDPQLLNMQDTWVQYYNVHIGTLDPLHITHLRDHEARVASLRDNSRTYSVASREYSNLLTELGVGDEIDLVFWRDNEPFACLGLTRPVGTAPFSREALDWESLRSYVESTLQLHWRVRASNIERNLIRKFELKPRELQVVELLTRGKSNSQISEILGISMATVKTHIVNIMNKMGADSRLSINTIVNRLQFVG